MELKTIKGIGEKTEKFEAMVEDNSKRNAEALQTNLTDEQVNKLNIDLKEHWQQDNALKEKTTETLERFNEDLNSSEEVVNDDKISEPEIEILQKSHLCRIFLKYPQKH